MTDKGQWLVRLVFTHAEPFPVCWAKKSALIDGELIKRNLRERIKGVLSKLDEARQGDNEFHKYLEM